MKVLKLIILLCFWAGGTEIFAQSFGDVIVHGFGGWGYGKTDGNIYILGTEEGDFRNVNFSLNLIAMPGENTTINTQIAWANVAGEDRVVLDYVFAEWRFSDLLKFRIGKIKTPFGIYTELFDVGTTRPFFNLPQSLYGTPGLVTKSYLGSGFTGSRYWDNGWGIQYDVYGGELSLGEYESPNPENVLEFDTATPRLRDMIGFRVITYLPVSGLRVGISGYSGDPRFEFRGEIVEDYFGLAGRHQVYSFMSEYISDAWTIRAEYSIIDEFDTDDVQASGYYVEAAYTVTENWQAAILYDTQEFKFLNSDILLSAVPSAVDHQEVAVGLNYWFNPNFVLKMSYHMVDGNLFARPDDYVMASIEDRVDSKTNMFIFGTNFSF